MMDWYDREGKPISIEEWGRLHEQYDYVRVELDHVGPYVVSTVWLGLDYRFVGDGPPIIFETMVFTNTAWNADPGDPDPEPLFDIECMRWSTEDEARRGHQELVTLVRATYVEDPYETPVEEPSDPEK